MEKILQLKQKIPIWWMKFMLSYMNPSMLTEEFYFLTCLPVLKWGQ